MPEGPEIRREADRIRRALRGRDASRVEFGLERLEPFENELSGRDVVDVTSRGKALLTRFGGGWTVYSHNQLYGRWYVTAAERRPSTTRQLRFAVHNERHSAWLYSASEIDVLRTVDESEHPFLERLGPDVLDRATTPETIAERLGSKTYRRRRLEGLLLDQGCLGGLGNYLRSEILWHAGAHPRERPMDLDDERLGELALQVKEITRRAYRERGVTRDPHEAAIMKAEGYPRREYRHVVFGLAGEACPHCGATVERMEAAGRRLYLCPACQPAPKSAAAAR